MKFRTAVELEQPSFQINYTHKSLFLGSCFAEHIAKKFKDLRLDCLSNPFGVLYNPVSIAKNLRRSIGGYRISEGDIFEYEGLFGCLDVHSEFTKTEKSRVLETIQKAYDVTCEKIKQTDVLFISFSGAMAFREKNSKNIVANCYKLPSSNFTQELLDLDLLKKDYQELFTQLFTLNPNIQIVLTVSPVRHIRYGLVQNNLSKARVFELTHFLVNTFDQTHYFASFELLNDELRDYRFFKEDMVHPTAQSIQHIFNTFSEHYFDDQTKSYCEALRKILLQKNHQALNPKSAAHQNFLKALKTQISAFEKQYDVSLNLE